MLSEPAFLSKLEFHELAKAIPMPASPAAIVSPPARYPSITDPFDSTCESKISKV
jgi:hypothetical protein